MTGQARQNVSPDLDPNCLQRLTAYFIEPLHFKFLFKITLDISIIIIQHQKKPQ